jgi:signal transduction histidine kinase
LEIDAYRGTISAGQFLSNDQVVGFVNITQKANPELKDKTSREGLIDTGAPTEDLVTLIKLLLAWIRQKPYAQYRKRLEDKSGLDAHRQQRVFGELDAVAEHLEGNAAGQAALARARKFYQAERNYLIQRAETTEQLAGVGLSVETASHDIMSVMNRALGTLDSLLQQLHADSKADTEEIERDLTSLRGMLSFIESQLKNIQLLFKSSKQRRRDVRVVDVLEKVQRLFQATLTKEKIDYQVIAIGSPVVAKTTDAVLLQLFLNLFDNAVYWLETKSGPRHILVTVDGDEQALIFSDDGPGIGEQDAPFIFEPFYSGRGDEGRGLGLYIAKQLLERHEYSIELADLKSQRKLRGANFVVSFGKGGGDD